jgi:hypothetical protein
MPRKPLGIPLSADPEEHLHPFQLKVVVDMAYWEESWAASLEVIVILQRLLSSTLLPKYHNHLLIRIIFHKGMGCLLPHLLLRLHLNLLPWMLSIPIGKQHGEMTSQLWVSLTI